MSNAEPGDPAALAAAQWLDEEITAVLAGRAAVNADPTVLWLATAVRAVPAPALNVQIRARSGRAWLPARLAAAVLACLLAAQGLGNLIAGGWVAQHIGEPFSPHVYFEGGLAFLAAAFTVSAGALRRRLMPVSVAAGAPLGVLLAGHGTTEFGVFAAGAALHLAQGLAALALLVTWVRARRYTPRGTRRPGMTTTTTTHTASSEHQQPDRVAAWLRVILLLLAIPAVFTGGWAVLAPADWYHTFPGFGPALVSAEPPFNEHLTSDAGAGFLALGVGLLLAAAWGSRQVVLLAALITAAQAIPHLIFHATHPAQQLSEAQNAGNLAALAAGAAVPLIIAWAARGARAQDPR